MVCAADDSWSTVRKTTSPIPSPSPLPLPVTTIPAPPAARAFCRASSEKCFVPRWLTMITPVRGSGAGQ